MGYSTHAQKESSEEAPRYCQEASSVWEVEAPLHITGFWLPVWHKNPLETGSLGAGLLLSPGVLGVLEEGEICPRTVQLVTSGVRVFEAERIPLLARLGGRLEKPKATIRLVLPVPLGSGYAASAALALAYTTLVAVSTRSIGFEDAAREAHIAEVEEGTGLGDVVAIYYGRMLEARTAPGGPGVGRVESFPVDASHVVTASLGFMSTSEMHSSRLESIKNVFSRVYTMFVENPSLDSFLEAARIFSIEVGFADRKLAEKLDRLVSKGLARGWYVKKKVVVVVPENGFAREVAKELEEVSNSIFIHEVSGTPLVARRAA